MNIEEHKYVKLLEYAVSQKGSYHMEPGLKQANMTEREFELIRDSIFINANMQAPPPGKSQVYDWRLKPEALFGFLAFKQYEHAQASANRAIWFSSVSLLVAITTLGISAL
jgi:hypothetical protein